MSVAEVEDRSIPVFEFLRRHGRPEEAHTLARLTTDMKSPHSSSKALEGIIARTSNRWREDAALAANGGTEWTHMLNELERSARQTLDARRGAANSANGYAEVMDALRQKTANAGTSSGPVANSGKRPRAAGNNAGKSVANERKVATPRRENTPPGTKTPRATVWGASPRPACARQAGARPPSVPARPQSAA